MVTPEEKQWGTLAHGLPLLVLVLTGLGPVAALVIFWMQKDKSKFVSFHALEALYFQLAVSAGMVIGYLTVRFFVGFLILAVVGLATLVVPLVAGLAAGKGELYEIPVLGKLARRQVGI